MAVVTATRDYETGDSLTAANYDADRDEIISGVNSIVNAQVNASAAIALSKLATGALPTGITIASANITNDSIVNADVNSAAAIVSTKLNLANGFDLVQTKTTGSTLTASRNLAAASTNAPVMHIIQDNAGDDQNALTIQNDGTGTGVYLTQSGNASGLIILTTSTSYGIYINEDGAGTALYINNATSTNPVVQIDNSGASNGLYLNQDGDAIALNIDSESTSYPLFYGDMPVADNVASFDIRHSGTAVFRVARINDANENVCIIIGSYYFWVDSTGDFRIKNSAPTSDTDGGIVGVQS